MKLEEGVWSAHMPFLEVVQPQEDKLQFSENSDGISGKQGSSVMRVTVPASVQEIPCVVMKVYGLTTPSPEAIDALYRRLEVRLDALVTEILATRIGRSPNLKVTGEDLRFITGFSQRCEAKHSDEAQPVEAYVLPNFSSLPNWTDFQQPRWGVPRASPYVTGVLLSPKVQCLSRFALFLEAAVTFNLPVLHVTSSEGVIRSSRRLPDVLAQQHVQSQHFGEWFAPAQATPTSDMPMVEGHLTGYKMNFVLCGNAPLQHGAPDLHLGAGIAVLSITVLRTSGYEEVTLSSAARRCSAAWKQSPWAILPASGSTLESAWRCAVGHTTGALSLYSASTPDLPPGSVLVMAELWKRGSSRLQEQAVTRNVLNIIQNVSPRDSAVFIGFCFIGSLSGCHRQPSSTQLRSAWGLWRLLG